MAPLLAQALKRAFDGIAGHRAVLDLLRHQLETERLPHAYLFVGEPRLGKTTVARALAQALLPQVRLDRHPDYWEDDRAEALKIDEIRLLPDHQPDFHQQSLQAFLTLKPALGKYRVAVISNVGRLADPVQGILLKTLEEPHPGRVIVLTTPSLSPFVVLPTIVSRCQRVSFHGVDESEIVGLLRVRGVAPERAALLAELSRGRPGWALCGAGDGSVVERHKYWTGRLEEVFGAPADTALRVAAEVDTATREWRRNGKSQPVDERGDDPVELALAIWQLQLRQRMVDEGDPASQARWARLLERSYDVVGYLEQNVNPRLALEVFLLEVSRA
jgi:DNA polymerase-3 subunit delta'